MPDLLLELFSEEIPARFQSQAAADLQRLVTDALVEQGLVYEGARAFSTPRRLSLHMVGLPARQADRREERKGPRLGAPGKAIEGFVRAAGLASIDEAKIVSDDKKGDFYLAVVEKPGREAEEVIAEIVPEVIRSFPWPKSMRWGRGTLRWVRPLQSILCTFGPETEEARVVAFQVDGIESSDITRGHRFMAPDEITVRHFGDYAENLAKAHVVLDAERRRDMILHDARDLAFAQGLELVEDHGLLDEVAGLVEWPVVLLGAFDKAFLDVPAEVLVTSLRAHQKSFSLQHPETKQLANKFVLVANLIAEDGGKAIVEGNERVIAARLSDAKFFWDLDRKTALDARVERLSEITFHDKLGSLLERVKLIRSFSADLVPFVPMSEGSAIRAAELCKTDLVTEMVGEFPELQGVMGRYYALAQGEEETVARAIEEHYLPQGPGDEIPIESASVVVALADKLSLLIGFWGIGETPTGSKDPYALRRAALGSIRVILGNRLRLPLTSIIRAGLQLYRNQLGPAFGQNVEGDLLAFFHDRLKVHLRDSGVRHDLIDAVIGPDADDLLMIVRRVEALGSFLDSDDGRSLHAGVKRAISILAIEEKKDGRSYIGAVDHTLIEKRGEPQERALFGVLEAAGNHVRQHVLEEDFNAAMRSLAELRPAVDAFFDHVTVNADDPALRENRLKLLNTLREAAQELADFSKIEG